MESGAATDGTVHAAEGETMGEKRGRRSYSVTTGNIAVFVETDLYVSRSRL